jgi:DNA-binding response OmpR family regulator
VAGTRPRNPFTEEIMRQRSRAVTLDVDPESLAQLRQALPGWDFQAADGATADLLERDWKPAAAGLVVVGARARPGEALGLCRGLRSQAGRAHTPLLVLVPAGQEALVRPVLAAGADHCLVLPVRAADLARVVADARAEDNVRRLDQDRYASAWQDDGGEG